MKNNPYVGPRPFERNDQRHFYGREREARALQSLIVAEREVLVYAQSGAGKTSLFNARIIPALESQSFRVLPVARVGSELPAGVQPDEVQNIFVFSALLALAGDDDPRALLGQTLATYLLGILQHEVLQNTQTELPCPPVLVFDQFEEIFTTHRTRWQEARGFFAQVREALDQIAGLGVVFSMREDHVAALDPYLPVFANRLRARFRLELLGPGGAAQAITRPAADAGLTFAEGVAERLLDDLRRTKIQGPGGQEEEVLGAFIEPVQLQVVCSQLWANLPEGKTGAINWEEIEQHGNVDRALTQFYEGALAAVTREAGLPERVTRRWFGSQLITSVGTRGLVMRGETDTAGLPNSAVDVLEDLHLIRADARAGARWYELSHDRLIAPIQAANRAWRAARETPLRAAARRWQETESAALLYQGRVLQEAAAWAKANPGELETFEQEFLEASQQAERIAQRRRRWLVFGGALAVLLAVVMGVLAVFAYQGQQSALKAQAEAESQRAEALIQKSKAESAQLFAEQQQVIAEAQRAEADAQRVEAEAQRAEAERQETLAQSREFAAQSRNVLAESQPQLGMLLAMQGIQLAEQGGESYFPAGIQVLRDGLSRSSGVALQGHNGPVTQAIFSADGSFLATASADGSVFVWHVLDSGVTAPQQPVVLPHPDVVTAAAFSPNGRWLATASHDKQVRLWDMKSTNPANAPIVLSGHSDLVTSVAFSPDGRWLASTSQDKTARLWDMTTQPQPGAQAIELKGHLDRVTGAAFSPNSRWLVTYGWFNDIYLWDLRKPDPAANALVLKGHEAYLHTAAFSANGTWLATADHWGTVALWKMDSADPSRQQPLVLNRHYAAVEALAFSPDGNWLASGSQDKTIYLWDLTARPPGSVAYPLRDHTGGVVSLSFYRQGENSVWLASGSEDNSLRLWQTSRIPVQNALPVPSESPNVPPPNVNPVTPNPYSWNAFNPSLALKPDAALSGLDGDASAVTFSPNGKWLVAGGSDGSTRLWPFSLPVSNGNAALLSTPLDYTYAWSASQDGRWLLANGYNAITLWDLTNAKKPKITLYGQSPDPLLLPGGIAAGISPDGKWLAVAQEDNVVHIWQTEERYNDSSAAPVILQGHNSRINRVVFSPYGDWLATGSEDGELRLWVVGDWSRAALLLAGHTRALQAVVFDPQGKWLATAGMDETLRVWPLAHGLSAANPPVPVVLPLPALSEVQAVAFSPDGTWLAACGKEISTHLWRLDQVAALGDRAAPVILKVDQQVVSTLAFHPDGNWLASGGHDFTVRLWDMAKVAAARQQPDPAQVSVALESEGQIQSLTFSPDGNWLLSGSRDQMVRVWNMAQPQAEAVLLSGHTGAVRAMQFLADGHRVVTGGEDSYPRLWELDLRQLLSAACQQIGRDWTDEERETYLQGQPPVERCP